MRGAGRPEMEEPMPQLMDSIQPKTLRELADGVAFRSGLPWRLRDLRVKALEAYRTAEPPPASLGLPPKQASGWMLRRIYEQVEETAGRMDPLPPDQIQPTPEQIETAIHVFTVEEWIGLIDGLDSLDTRALLSHIRHNSGELKQRLGARRIERIEGRAIMRDTDLWLAEHRDTLVPASDPYWAGFWRELTRQANREGVGRLANGRPIAELASDRVIARSLTKRDEQTGREMKVTRHQVKEWRARMEELPYEQYASEMGAESDEERAAAFLDYVTMIRADHRHGRK